MLSALPISTAELSKIDWESLLTTWGVKLGAALAVLLVGLWVSRWLDNLLPRAVGRAPRGRRSRSLCLLPAPSWPCPPCMNRCISGQAASSSQGSMPSAWARCSLKNKNAAMAAKPRKTHRPRLPLCGASGCSACVAMA